MDKYFMMSRRFDKKLPEDFGLVLSNDPEIFIMPSDKSKWKIRKLYDFGWGKENGFYKLPLLNFDELCNLILSSEIEDNKYGAASIILDDYNYNLLKKCQEIFINNKNLKMYKEFFEILELYKPINRSTIIGKNYKEIKEDFKKWVEIAEKIKTI